MCIGVQKAGTTSLHEILKQHPDINLPQFKESHFFSEDKNFTKGINYYFDYYFSKINEKQILGEIDPEYIFFDKSLERISQFFKDIKIIVILRNPVDRAFSHYNMSCRRGFEKLDFKNALKDESIRLSNHFETTHFSYISRGLYYKQLCQLFSVFKKEQIKIFLYDDYKSSPEKVVKEICEFVELKPINFDYNINKNKASKTKSNRVRDFIYKDNFLKKFGGKLLKSKKLKLKIMQGIERINLTEGQVEKLSHDDKKYIYKNFFKDDILRTEKLLHTNLDKWKYGLD